MSFYDIEISTTATQYFVKAMLPKSWGWQAFQDHAADENRRPDVEAFVRHAVKYYGADVHHVTLVDVGTESRVEPFGPDGELVELVEFLFVDFIDGEDEPYVIEDEEEYVEDLSMDEYEGEEMDAELSDWLNEAFRE